MVVVFGSINLDLVARVPRLPQPGETIAGLAFGTSPGGKGANQALAARRAAADVALFGAVGRDTFAAPALRLLREDGVRLTTPALADESTGVAVVHVDSRGENAITVIAGANAHAKSGDIPDVLLGPGTTLLLQLEAPASESRALARRARTLGARVVLNPAPAHDFDAAWRDLVDVLIVNETECALVGDALGAPHEPRAFANALARCGVLACVTLGAQGVIAAHGSELYRVPALAVEVVDTVGAGDAFTGVFAASLDAGLSLADALARAAAAAGLACTREGAQAALPRAVEIDRHAHTLESRIVVTPLPS
jgi:ribokinase